MTKIYAGVCDCGAVNFKLDESRLQTDRSLLLKTCKYCGCQGIDLAEHEEMAAEEM